MWQGKKQNFEGTMVVSKKQSAPGFDFGVGKASKKAKEETEPVYVAKFTSLIALMAIIILIPGYLFLVRAGHGAADQSKALFARQKDELDQLKASISGYYKIISNYRLISQADKGKLDDLLPGKVDESSLYVNLESLARANGLDLASIEVSVENIPMAQKSTSQGEASGSGQLRQANISLGLKKVSYSKLNQFLKAIEANLRLLDVKSFSYKPENSSLEIEMVTYFLE